MLSNKKRGYLDKIATFQGGAGEGDQEPVPEGCPTPFHAPGQIARGDPPGLPARRAHVRARFDRRADEDP